MATGSSMGRAFLPAWFALVLLAGQPALAAEGYIGTPGDAARAAGLVSEALDRKAQVHTIRITEKDVTVLVRGDARPGDVEEWKVRTANRFFFFPSEGVSGPSAKPAPAIVADPAAGFFSLDDIALDKVSEVVGRAIAYARLQDTATIQTIEIARRVNLLPTPAYGDIRWTLYISSPRETATVYTDAAGTIIGGDLSNTVRARNMDFYKDDDWPKEAALESLISVIGTRPIVRDITIYPKSVQVKADHPTLPETTVGYSWDLSGVTRSAITSPMFPGTAQQPALSLADIDLAPLAKVRDNAIKAWGNEKSSLNYLMLRLFSEGPGKPEQRWTVHFTDWGQPGELTLFSNGGSIELAADGTVRVANLPAARQPKRNWLDPKTTRETLAAVGEQFGKNARFSEISVNNDSHPRRSAGYARQDARLQCQRPRHHRLQHDDAVGCGIPARTALPDGRSRLLLGGEAERADRAHLHPAEGRLGHGAFALYFLDWPVADTRRQFHGALAGRQGDAGNPP